MSEVLTLETLLKAKALLDENSKKETGFQFIGEVHISSDLEKEFVKQFQLPEPDLKLGNTRICGMKVVVDPSMPKNSYKVVYP